MSEKYGNNHFWCFIEENWNGKEVAIWSAENHEEFIIARASDNYEAKRLIDALINYTPIKPDRLNKKQLAFLEFVCYNCQEPYSTMAGNAIMWNDVDAYKNLIEKFYMIYS